MLTARQKADAERMLADGASCRAVARALGVSRHPICDIRNGVERAYHGASVVPDPGRRSSRGPVGRCPSCRFKVVLPCVACFNAGLVDSSGALLEVA